MPDKSCSEHKNTHFMLNKVFFRKMYLLWDMWKNTADSGRPRWKYGACTLHVEYLRLQTHTQNM